MLTAPGELLAALTIGTGTLSLLCLLTLHFVSREFQPSWRMVSEYALGRHKWLITAFFLLWGASSIALALALWPLVESPWARSGVILLAVSGIGATMGGLFDVRHRWHGLAFLLGVPTLPIAALLIGHHLVTLERWGDQYGTVLIGSHAVWISLLLMAAAMAVMFSGFKKAGIPMNQDSPPPDRVPEGVIALGGYANRWLVLCYLGWSMLIAALLLSLYD